MLNFDYESGKPEKMKKAILILILAGLFAGYSFSQLQKGQVDPQKVTIPGWHYQPEFTFDRPSDPASWQRQSHGLNAAFGSTDERYLRSEVPLLSGTPSSWESTGWKGERLNAQLLVWSPDTLHQVRIVTGDLSDSKGHLLRKDIICASMVRYVLSNYPYGDKGGSCDAVSTDTAFLLPDRLEKFDRFELPGQSLRPIWISFEIPRDAIPGVYKGFVEVVSEKNNIKLPVRIIVQEQVLPQPHDWKYRLDLWQNPWVIAWYYHVEPWSEEHMVLLRKHMKLYADAGGKYITTYAVHSPWSDNSYMIEGTMIEWLKRKDGTWKFDYAIFDKYVQLAMETGIDKAITIYTPVPWGHRFRYLDEVTGNYIYEEWAPDSPEFKAFWNIFLNDLKVHLTMKGWMQKTYLGINENPLEYTLAAAKIIKDNSRGWKITYAGDWHPELTQILDDYSPVIGSEPGQQQLAERKSRGATTTFYICCTPARPNTFVFSPPVEGRYVSWYASAYGYDGFLRWAYDAWSADPVRDARHTLWPAGDCFLVYPGANSSIRFEKLREGIVDYEKIRILRELAGKSSNPMVKNKLKELDDLLTTFIGDPDLSKRDFDTQKITGMIQNGEKIIIDLSDVLAGD
jgi:hypothetical protein